MLGYRWLIIVMALFLSGVVHSEEAPAGPDVCDAMTSAGEDLRAGSLSSFYFVEGLGAEFPVPKFMKAVPVYDFSGIQVEASEFPGFPPAGIAQRMRLEAIVVVGCCQLGLGRGGISRITSAPKALVSSALNIV